MWIFWKYCLGHYLKVLALAVFSFIAILFVSRLEEISGLAAMGARSRDIALFTLYQIPYILPLAIPISSLISSMILFQSLSSSYELLAFRASGMSLKKIIAPVLFAGAILSIGNFYITSEIASSSHLAIRKMVYNLSSVNPLILLQNSKIAQLKGAYVQMDPIRNGAAAENVIIAVKNHSQERIHLFMAKKVEVKESAPLKSELLGEGISVISSAPSKDDFDSLMIENQIKTSSSAAECAGMLRQSGWKVASDHLKFSWLRVRIETLKKKLAASKTGNEGALNSLHKCYSEIMRRLSLGFSPFTFTLMGAVFGIEISRNHSRKGLFSALILAAISLTAFFIGKELDHLFALATTLFLLPHLLILAVSYRTIVRINRGIE